MWMDLLRLYVLKKIVMSLKIKTSKNKQIPDDSRPLYFFITANANSGSE